MPNKAISKEELMQKYKVAELYIFKFFKLIILLILILIFLIGYKFLLVPKWNSIDQVVEAENKAKEKQKADMEEYMTKLNRFKESYFDIPEIDRQRINYMIPDGTKAELIFLQMEDLARKQGLILNQLSVSKTDEISTSNNKKQPSKTKVTQPGVNLPSDVGIVTVNASFIGTDYNGHKHLLETLERNLKLFDIVNLKFDPNSKLTEVNFHTYYIK